MDEPFFFDNNNHRLFGILHQPDYTLANLTPSVCSHKNTGLVFCAPFAEEKLWSHRVFANFAKTLASKDFSVLRFDYMGHGDSEGNFEDSTIETRISDIIKSVNVLREKSNVTKVGLLGLRLGATLAAIVVEKIKDIDFLVLWEPIVKVEEYLQQCLRSNLTTQMAIYKKITRNRKQITQDLLIGKSANIDGYLVSGEFYKQAAKIDLSNYDFYFQNPVQIVHISKNETAPIKSELKELYENNYRQLNHYSTLSMVVESPFWNEIKIYYQEAHNLFRDTLHWLDSMPLQD